MLAKASATSKQAPVSKNQLSFIHSLLNQTLPPQLNQHPLTNEPTPREGRFQYKQADYTLTL